MTSEEKQEIINAVLAALRTNSKSIDQLTSVSEMSDTDFLELNGGRKVSYGVLFANHMSNDETQEAWGYLDTHKVDKDLRGLVEVHQAPVVFLDAMGILDGHALNGSDGLEYRPDYKQIFDFPDGLFGAPKAGAVYISKNNFKKFVWNGTDLEELKADECPLFVDYSEPVAFATLPVGGSYYVPSSHKIAVKIDASNTKTYDPLPDALYFFRDKGMIYTWKSSTNKWVPVSSDINVVNNLTDGGEGDALSAEMGIRLKNAIIQLWTAIGNYAFPGGRPMLDFSGGSQTEVAEVSTIFGQRVTPYAGESDVSIGDQLTVQLSTSDDLYVIDPSTVKVMMGGTDVTSSCYNENTDVVNIPTVIDDVEITANAMTYVQDNLVLHLDGRHRGGAGSVVAGHWKSLVNYNGSPIDFTLTSCDESNNDYVHFDGQSSKGIGSVSLLDVAAASGSIEAVYGGVELNSQACVIMHNAIGLGSRICMSTGHGSLATGVNMLTMAGAANNNTAPSNVTYEGIMQTDFLAGHYLSCVQGAFLVEGESKTPAASTQQASNANSMLSLFYRKTSNDMFFKGNLYALRVYSDKLTPAEQLQNHKVDKKRFNL